MKRRILVKSVFVLLLLLVLMVVQSDDDNDIHDNPDMGWYEVADWEVELCSKWGGIYDQQNAASGESPGKKMSNYTSLDITATIQAGILEVLPSNITLPNNTRVYEVSWYVQPVAESINYEVSVIYSDGTKELLESSSATPYTNFDGYWANQTDKNMTYAVLKVPTKSIELEVEFIETEEE